jgi:CheY-like chemotaxis protein
LTERNTRRNPTILIVEDELLLRSMIADYLREAGWNVLEAANGEDAFAHLDGALAIDIVFTDIRLDGSLNGWDVGEASRRKISGIPVIYATGLSIEPPREVEGSMLLNKPYDPEQVRAACERLTAARGQQSKYH